MDENDEEMECEEMEGSSIHYNETLVERLDDDQSQADPHDDIKILIATDIHVGYAENKPVIGDDSVNTFEEVLQIAVKENVDMILLGGDLFHENNPSRDMMCKVVRLLRKYCLNDRDVLLQFVSDPAVNFKHSKFARVNYEDMNLNIGLPIFTIHGNHDDMAAKGLTALDELHESGLINLFGKFEECEGFEVSPILIKKGSSRLALYGIGSQRDDRLNRAFESAAIKFLRPRSDAEGWFNILAIHQNRPPRSVTRTTGNYLPVKYIPSFFDVVLWGHEHECKIAPEYVDVSSELEGDGFFILQPGSTVATSLTAEEALPKHVSLLTVRGRKFQYRPIRLETVRQMYVEKLVFCSLPPGYTLPPNGTRPEPIRDNFHDEVTVREQLKALLEKAKRERRPLQPELPLVRINVLYTDAWAHMTPMTNRCVSTAFASQVANPNTIVVSKKERRKGEEKKGYQDDFSSFSALDPTVITIEELASEYFKSLPYDDRLTVLSEDLLKDAVHKYTTSENLTMTATKKKLDETIESKLLDVQRRLAQNIIRELDENPTSSLPTTVEDTLKKDLLAMKRMMYSDKIRRPNNPNS